MRIANCLAADELSAFNLGQLPEGSVQAVAEHLAECPACQTALTALETQADSLVAGLRRTDCQSVLPESYAGETEFHEAVQKVKAIALEQRPEITKDAAPDSSVRAIATPPADAKESRPMLTYLREYQLLEKLGQGGMGVLYKALHIRLKRVVALKVLPPERMNQPAAAARFQREMEAVGRLNHPHIVRATDAGEVDGTHFLVMEFIEGTDLSRLVHARGPLPVAEACEIIRQAAAGLEHVHRHGLVHRDVKPSNLLLTREGEVKVLDLGLALLKEDHPGEEELTATGQVMGTFDYMAPEQGGDTHAVDIRADVYSLGCTLYFLLAGKAPFSGPQYQSGLKKMMAHAQAPVPPIQGSLADLPAGLVAVLARMLAKDPGGRFATATEVAAALEPFIGGCDLSRLGKTTQIPLDVSAQEPKTQTGTAEYVSSAMTGTTPNAEPDAPVEPGPMPASKARSHRRRRFVLAIAGAALVGGIILLGAIITLKTRNGTLVVTVSEPGVQVFVDGEEKVTIDSKKVGRVELIAGKHKLTVRRGREELYTKAFTLKSGGETLIQAKWTPKSVQATKPKQKVDEAWIKAVVAMKPEEQVKAVAAKLKELNPNFDGKVSHEVHNGEVSGLQFATDAVTDISPVRALPRLTNLNCSGSGGGKGKLSDLSPLKGMPLVVLSFYFTKVSDLTPLKGLPLITLNFSGTGVSDLSLLKGMPLQNLSFAQTNVSDLIPLKTMHLTSLVCFQTNVSDLSPLKDMPLRYIACYHTQVSDLSPLKAMPLTHLECMETGVSDLSPLKGMRLINLLCYGTKLSDLSPLKGMPLKELWCDFKPYRDTQILRSLKTLEKINGQPAAKFWKEVDARQAAFDGWVKQVRRLEPEKQVESVAAKLKELNPGFDGKVTHKVEKGMVTELQFVTDAVTDISPVRAVAELKKLEFYGSAPRMGKLSDLSPLRGMQLTLLYCWETQVADLLPLKGMPLKFLHCGGTKVSDLAPLKGMRLRELMCWGTQVSDMTPLKGMPLIYLNCGETKVSDLAPLKGMALTHLYSNSTGVSDLSPLKGMPLRLLYCDRTAVSDLSPLKGMPLTELGCDFKPERDTEILRSLKKLEKINDKPAADFWKQVESPPVNETQEQAIAAIKKLGGRVQIDATDPERPFVTFVWLQEPKVTDADLSHLQGFRKLQGLLLGSAKVGDEGLAHIKDLTHLQQLELNGNKVSDKGLVQLKGLFGLRTLGLSCTAISDAGLAHLKDLTRLRSLMLYNTKVGDVGLANIKTLTELRTLWLGHTRVSDMGLAHLQGMRQLHELLLDHTRVTDAGLAHLKGLSNLAHLSLAQTEVNGKGLVHLKGLPKIRYLGLDDSEINDAGLKNLEGFSQLEMLSLNNTQIGDAGLAHIEKLTKLWRLNLNNTRITDAGLTQVKKLTQLQELLLSQTGISDAGLAHLKGLTRLNTLSLDHTRISDRGLIHLKSLTGLRSVSLTGTQITDAGLAHLKNLGQLQLLNVMKTKITDKGVEDLQRTLPKLRIVGR